MDTLGCVHVAPRPCLLRALLWPTHCLSLISGFTLPSLLFPPPSHLSSCCPLLSPVLCWSRQGQERARSVSQVKATACPSTMAAVPSWSWQTPTGPEDWKGSLPCPAFPSPPSLFAWLLPMPLSQCSHPGSLMVSNTMFCLSWGQTHRGDVETGRRGVPTLRWSLSLAPGCVLAPSAPALVFVMF